MKSRKSKVKGILNKVTTLLAYMFMLGSVVVVTGTFIIAFIKGITTGEFATYIRINSIGEAWAEMIFLVVCWMAFLYYYRRSVMEVVGKMGLSPFTKGEERAFILGFFALVIGQLFLYLLMGVLVM